MTQDITALARRARAALPALAAAPGEQRDAFLRALAARLRADPEPVLAANAADLAAGAHLDAPMRDRLRLDGDRLATLADGLDALAALADPLGVRFDQRTLANGLRLHRRRVPLGVLGAIYEARPNVTLDIAALAIKTGNAAVLRGGSESLASNRALVGAVHAALADTGLPVDAVGFVDSPNRAAVAALLAAGDDIDLMIPRGGAGLHAFCRQHARMPVVTGGIGICHLYVDAAADLARALAVIANAKTQRPTVCNALDTVLVHQAVAARFLPMLAADLHTRGVELRLAPAVRAALDAAGFQATPGAAAVVEAGSGDFDREWLALVLGIDVVDGLDAAIAHIARHGSGHSDGILTDDADQAARFLDRVDSAAVYWNASTRFTDGGEFGLGAEVAVSTQRVHARGPMGLEQLTSWKWVVEGDYHVR
ncbi:MAG: glutamate-5-semialdehyde dehydrogenase [Xanthomonadales bacterium]|nr:glutamate-5-semialdehyde dehydrogenase [Xanthomonadales bacterium]